MNTENKYLIIKRVSILMALDAVGAITETVMKFISAVFNSADASSASVFNANIYVSWTLWTLRLLIWILTLVSLSRMAEICASFGKARIWYLTRALSFITLTWLSGTINYLYYQRYGHDDFQTVLNANPDLPRFLGVCFLLFMGMDFIMEAFSLSFGNRAILIAGAELLESFGLEKPAEKNRRCGKLLAGFAAAYTSCLVCAFVFLSAASSFVSVWDAEGVPEILIPLALILIIIICVPSWIGIEIFRILAAVRMRRAYHAIRELTE